MKKEEKIKRLKWMLYAVESGELLSGLCVLYRMEYGTLLTNDMPEIKPSGKGVKDYWFPKKEEEPRVKFLREWIDKLSVEKSLVQQLVDNVNQSGGEIFGLKVGDKLPADTINAWFEAGKNCYSKILGLVRGDGKFLDDREIKSFFVVDGEIFFEVSDTLDVCLRAEGYKKFAEEFETPEQTYSIGQRFRSKYVGDYILAAVGGGKVVLINLSMGSRWGDPVSVEHEQRITQKEFKSITGISKMTLIDKK